jgi:colanic acid/amylovoran biosynthesis glycosyltransferase
LHFLGEDLWNRALKRGCPTDKLHALIPPAIDAVFFSPGDRVYETSVGSGSRPFRILSVGRLHWKKGYEYALQAVRGLIERNVQCEYRIVGSGEYVDGIAFARHQLGLHRTVELMGPRSPEEVKQEYLWADAFLHPAVSEGFSNAVMEAQAMALPVVCTDADGLAENVASGETGFVVPRRDSDALTEKLALLAHDAKLRRRMGTAGRERVIERFLLERQLQAFATLYRKTLEGLHDVAGAGFVRPEANSGK